MVVVPSALAVIFPDVAPTVTIVLSALAKRITSVDVAGVLVTFRVAVSSTPPRYTSLSVLIDFAR